MIVNDQNLLSDANVRIGTLQDSIETLNSEVKKLSQVLTLLSMLLDTSKFQYVSKQGPVGFRTAYLDSHGFQGCEE